MNKITYFTIGALVIAVITIGVIGYTVREPIVNVNPEIQVPLGVAAGTDHYNVERFHAGFGGEVLATSTNGTATTLKESELVRYSVIEMTSANSNFTYTLPATSTLTSILKNIGDTQTWVLQNASTTAANTITLAAGAGWNLSGDDTNVDVIAGAAYTARVSMYIQCYRQNNKDIHCNLSEAIAVD